MQVIEFTCPIPPQSLNPNNAPYTKGAKMAQIRDKNRWQSAVMAAVNNVRPDRPFVTADIELEYHLYSGASQCDEDNLRARFKYGQDALELAGVIENDRGFRVTKVVAKNDRRNMRLVVRITQTN